MTFKGGDSKNYLKAKNLGFPILLIYPPTFPQKLPIIHERKCIGFSQELKGERKKNPIITSFLWVVAKKLW